MKDVLNCATVMHGVQSVMMDLRPVMQMLHVGSLDYLVLVSIARSAIHIIRQV